MSLRPTCGRMHRRRTLVSYRPLALQRLHFNFSGSRESLTRLPVRQLTRRETTRNGGGRNLAAALTQRPQRPIAISIFKLFPAAPAGFWEREVARRENPSVKSTAAILALLSPRASAALDRALRYERVIYDAAVVVHDRRCRAHLGSERCAARGGRAPS